MISKLILMLMSLFLCTNIFARDILSCENESNHAKTGCKINNISYQIKADEIPDWFLASQMPDMKVQISIPINYNCPSAKPYLPIDLILKSETGDIAYEDYALKGLYNSNVILSGIPGYPNKVLSFALSKNTPSFLFSHYTYPLPCEFSTSKTQSPIVQWEDNSQKIFEKNKDLVLQSLQDRDQKIQDVLSNLQGIQSILPFIESEKTNIFLIAKLISNEIQLNDTFDSVSQTIQKEGNDHLLNTIQILSELKNKIDELNLSNNLSKESIDQEISSLFSTEQAFQNAIQTKSALTLALNNPDLKNACTNVSDTDLDIDQSCFFQYLKALHWTDEKIETIRKDLLNENEFLEKFNAITNYLSSEENIIKNKVNLTKNSHLPILTIEADREGN